MITLRKHRFAFILMSLSTIFVALAPLFLIASCRPLQQTPPELKARETLRTMTRGGVLPSEDAVAQIEKDFPKTTAGALAKIVHARNRLNARDYAAAALLLAAKAYEQTGNATSALAAYRRLYFFAPNLSEAGEAAAALTRLGSSTNAATAEEASARAQKLFAAKRFSEAYDAYTDA